MIAVRVSRPYLEKTGALLFLVVAGVLATPKRPEGGSTALRR